MNVELRFGKFGGGVGDWKCMDHCHETGAFRNFLCNIVILDEVRARLAWVNVI